MTNTAIKRQRVKSKFGVHINQIYIVTKFCGSVVPLQSNFMNSYKWQSGITAVGNVLAVDNFECGFDSQSTVLNMDCTRFVTEKMCLKNKVYLAIIDRHDADILGKDTSYWWCHL